jgi:hypothetical protein
LPQKNSNLPRKLGIPYPHQPFINHTRGTTILCKVRPSRKSPISLVSKSIYLDLAVQFIFLEWSVSLWKFMVYELIDVVLVSLISEERFPRWMVVVCKSLEGKVSVLVDIFLKRMEELFQFGVCPERLQKSCKIGQMTVTSWISAFLQMTES